MKAEEFKSKVVVNVRVSPYEVELEFEDGMRLRTYIYNDARYSPRLKTIGYRLEEVEG